MQRMLQPFSLQKTQEPFHGTELRILYLNMSLLVAVRPNEINMFVPSWFRKPAVVSHRFRVAQVPVR